MSEMMQQYLEDLIARYEVYHDVERTRVVAGWPLEVYAVSKVRNEKYLASRSVTIYAYEIYTHGLVTAEERVVDETIVRQFCQSLRNAVSELVSPHDEHMCTYLDGVLVTPFGFTPEAIRYGQRFRHGKMFKLGLAGFCDVRLLLVDLALGQVYANRLGREVRKHYLPQRVPS